MSIHNIKCTYIDIKLFLAQGTGMGSGEGKKDVTDEIEDEGE